jgi:hypothetical protein
MNGWRRESGPHRDDVDIQHPRPRRSKILAALLSSQGRFVEAEPLLLKAVLGAKTAFRLDWESSLNAQLGLAHVLPAERKTDELAPLLRSIEAQIGRYHFGGSDIEAGLRRLNCLASKKSRADAPRLRA